MRSTVLRGTFFVVSYLFSVHFACTFSLASGDVYFTKDCELQVIKLIDGSTKTIDAAVYDISHPVIAQHLMQARRRGVNIRFLTDRLQAFQAKKERKLVIGLSHIIDLKLHSHNRIMHNKFATFDGKAAILGSYNWTVSASTVNAESCIVLHATNNEPAVSTLQKQFEFLWQENHKDISDCYLYNLSVPRSKYKKCAKIYHH